MMEELEDTARANESGIVIEPAKHAFGLKEL
jgi:hypothetical protein